MNNVVYHINKEKGVVVAIIKSNYSEPQDIFESIVTKNRKAGKLNIFSMYDPYFNFDKTGMKNQYVGIARCSKNDTFDEEFGKNLALARAKVKKTYDLQKQFFKYVDSLDDINYIVGKKYDKLYEAYCKSVDNADVILKEAYK